MGGRGSRSCARNWAALQSSAFAQNPSPPPVDLAEATSGGSAAQAEVERVIVTGSNIPTAEEVGPNPVLTINRDLIEKSGERTAEELIRNTTVAGPNGVPTSNNGAGNTPGASSISPRGFDPSDTLVLIDGQRIAPFRSEREMARKPSSISIPSRERCDRTAPLFN